MRKPIKPQILMRRKRSPPQTALVKALANARSAIKKDFWDYRYPGYEKDMEEAIKRAEEGVRARFRQQRK